MNISQNTDTGIFNQKENQIANNGTAGSVGNQLTSLGGLRMGNLGTLISGIQIGTATLTVVRHLQVQTHQKCFYQLLV